MSSSSNRAAMPNVAAIVDELRAQDLAPKVLWAREGGLEIGQRPIFREVFEIPKGYRMESGNAPRRKG